jgi:hypothetical protein
MCVRSFPPSFGSPSNTFIALEFSVMIKMFGMVALPLASKQLSRVSGGSYAEV